MNSTGATCFELLEFIVKLNSTVSSPRIGENCLNAFLFIVTIVASAESILVYCVNCEL